MFSPASSGIDPAPCKTGPATSRSNKTKYFRCNHNLPSSMKSARDFDQELFKENNDHCYSTNSKGPSRTRARALRIGCKSKSLDIFDRPMTLATTQSISTSSISRRPISRVKSLASIPENSVEQSQVRSLCDS